MHAAPRSMLYYGGSKFAELQGKLIVGLHGRRPTGSRVILYDVPTDLYLNGKCTDASGYYVDQNNLVAL